MTTSDPSVGYQLSASQLHERQRNISGVPGPLVVAAGVSDPLNLGSIFRICDAAGCQQLWLVDCPLFSHDKMRRISRNTSDTLPHLFLTTTDFLTRVPSLPPLVAIEITSNSKNMFNAKFEQPTVFVVGNEKYGIPDQILSVCTQAIHIPMFGINSSMNVATSLGIILYEWHRRTSHIA